MSLNSNVSIDPAAHRKLAEAVRHFASGQTTNDESESSMPRSKEWALHDIAFFGVWPFYDDFKTHKLSGEWSATPAGNRRLARVVLFLRSGQPYEYSRQTGLRGRILLLFTILTLATFACGLSASLAMACSLFAVVLAAQLKSDVAFRRLAEQNDFWPFYCKENYESALTRPVYLTGSTTR